MSATTLVGGWRMAHVAMGAWDSRARGAGLGARRGRIARKEKHIALFCVGELVEG